MTSEPGAKRQSLKSRLYVSHLSIAAGAAVLLIAALFVTHALRVRALHLATRSGPLALSAKSIQASLAQAEASLRGWMALGEPRLREENRQTWQDVYAELERLEALQDGSSVYTDDVLARLKGHLLDLEEWHWYIAEVSRTPGNEPARYALRTNVAPVQARLEEIVEELIARNPTREQLALLAALQTGILRSGSALQEFVDDGLPPQALSVQQQLATATTALETLRRGGDDSALVIELSKEITAFRVYSEDVLELRRREDWNVSSYWLASGALNHGDEAHALLDRVVAVERAGMEQDEETIVQIGRIGPPVMLALLLLMAVGALIASLRAARRITEPVRALDEASRLLALGQLDNDIPIRSTDEIGSLTTSFNAMRAALLERHRELQDSQTRLETTFATVVDALVTIDERGTVESLNPAAEQLFGVPASDAIGKNVRQFMPEPYKGEHDGYLQRYLETNDPRVIGIGREVIGVNAAGDEFPAELAVNEMWIAGERKFAGIIRDITERKRVDRMKNEFISVVSHELRTPLTSVRGSLGLMASGVVGDVPEDMQNMLDIAVRSTDRLIRLINDILDIEKIESGQMGLVKEVLPARAVFEQAMAANLGIAERDKVRFDLQDETDSTGRIEADRDRLLQVVTNLISNAVKYSPEEGTVELKIERLGTKLRLSVSDHGPGIPEAFHGRIFKKFTQADSSSVRQKAGTGLGLSISQAIVEMHGGTLSFHTEEGLGTTFFFELDEWVKAQAPSRAGSGAGQRVLVCEDDPDIGTLLCVLLEKEGVVCDLATTAEEARELVISAHYAGLFLDINLPGQDGLALIKDLRSHSRTRELPIVVVSATAEASSKTIDGSAFRVLDWISKPIDVDRLKQSLAAALASSKSSSKSVLYVEDDPSLIELVPRILEGEADLRVAQTVAEARRLIAEKSFDLALLDIALPDGSGLELIPALNDSRPGGTPILIFSAYETPPESANQVAGALLKSRSSNQTLVDSVRALLSRL